MTETIQDYNSSDNENHMVNVASPKSNSSESVSDGLGPESGISDEDGDTSDDLKKEESSETTDSENDKSIAHRSRLEDYIQNINDLDHKCLILSENCKELQGKLDLATKQQTAAVREKEIIVMKYAMGEKTVLDLKSAKESMEKKFKDAIKENEILQHKLCSMFSEKSRICQLLDNKCYELKSSQHEVEKVKSDLSNYETKVKWLQNNLRTEMDLRMESEKKVEALTASAQDHMNQIEQTKQDTQDAMNNFLRSQENRANVLDHQVKEQQANLILLRHDRDDRDKQLKTLQLELERLQTKQKETLQENNTLSMRVQHLERERLENEQRLSELRTCAEQQRQDAADLAAKTAQVEQLKFQLQNEQEQLTACNEQVTLLKNRNTELESDMESCREREAELLIFTQQLTDKNVRLQSEFIAMETKVQQLSCEQTILRRAAKEQETKVGILSKQLTEAENKRTEEVLDLSQQLTEKNLTNENLLQEVAFQKGENQVIKRKLELSLKEVSKELHACRKKIESYETASTSSNSSSTSLNTIDHQIPHTACESLTDQVKVIQPEGTIDKQTLIERIVTLQRVSARKSEKIDFLEEHINTLVAELQRKTRLLQNYMMREPTGTMTSNKMDKNKANIERLNGVMASLYGCRVADENLTLELSLDINHKLQAVLEDALLKNITLKENVDTLGTEIDKLNNLLKSS